MPERREWGVVANVVTTAMITSMAKSWEEITPRSSPRFRTINSISPRVFIRIPSDAASRQFIPVSRAATADPPNFPAQATTMIAPQTSHCEPSISLT